MIFARAAVIPCQNGWERTGTHLLGGKADACLLSASAIHPHGGCFWSLLPECGVLLAFHGSAAPSFGLPLQHTRTSQAGRSDSRHKLDQEGTMLDQHDTGHRQDPC